MPPRSKRKQDLAAGDVLAWRKWKSTTSEDNPDGDMESFRAVYDRIKPHVEKEVNRYARNTQIPKEALRATTQNWAVKAIRKFDPDRFVGSNLVGFVSQYTQKLYGFTVKNQNMGRITEKDARLLGTVSRNKAALSDMLGRSPTQMELANHLKQVKPLLDNKPVSWSPKYLDRLETVQRKDLLSSGFDESPSHKDMTRESELSFVIMLRAELPREQQQILDYMYGLNGKDQLGRNKEIAKKTGLTETTVSRRKSAIQQAWRRYRS